MIRCSLAALIAVAILGSGCGRRAGPPPKESWAVLLFDDLSPDGSQRWLRRGIPEQLGRQLRRPPRLVAILSQPDPQASRASAIAAGATHIVRGTFEARGKSLKIHAEIESLGDHSFRSVDDAGSAGPVSVVADLARRIDPNAAPSPVKSAAALQAFSEALDETNPESAIGKFRRAIDADPDFGAAYLGFASIAARTGRAPEAIDLLRTANARSSLADPVDHNQVSAELAALTGDRAAFASALNNLARTLATDPQAWARASEAWVRAGRPEQSAKALEQALALAPANPDYLNQLGYARAYQGDLMGATEALEQYRKLRPSDPNAFDSLGDVYYFNNRYADAAGFYREAYKLKPDFFNGVSLLKAAYATLWTGDVAAGERIFTEYRKSRESRNDPAIPIVNAEWLFFSGKRTEGVQVLDNLGAQFTAAKQGVLASRAYSLASVWSMALGESAKAQIQARKAREASGGSSVESLSLILTQPKAPAPEWISRAQHMFPANAPPAAVTPILATVLIFGEHYQAALPYLDQWSAQMAGQPGDFTPALKAWCLFNLGRIREADSLLRFTPLIPSTGLPPVANLVFPRLFFLRARLAEANGRTEEAHKLDRLFLDLSGDRDKIFGEEALARKKAAGRLSR